MIFRMSGMDPAKGSPFDGEMQLQLWGRHGDADHADIPNMFCTRCDRGRFPLVKSQSGKEPCGFFMRDFADHLLLNYDHLTPLEVLTRPFLVANCLLEKPGISHFVSHSWQNAHGFCERFGCASSLRFTAHWRSLRCGGKVDGVGTAAVPFVSVNLKVWTSGSSGEGLGQKLIWIEESMALGDLARSSKIGGFTANFTDFTNRHGTWGLTRWI